MKYIETNWDIPFYNMALEEYLMQSDEHDEDYLFFYIHKPSVIIGRYQNAMSEVNRKYLDDNGIILSRRISGGGAVYHDEGNLNFSFVCRKDDASIDFEPYLSPVIKALGKLGIDPVLSGRNDLILDGRKIGGNAQHLSKDKVLSHGTILVDVNMENMTNALNVDPQKYKSKGIASVRSRVTNLNEHLKEKISAYRLRDFLIGEFALERMTLSREDMLRVEAKVKEKFSLWEYNYGGSIRFCTTKKRRFPSALVEFSYEAKDGKIEDIAASGDFFAKDSLDVLYSALRGCPLKFESIVEALKGTNVIAGISAEDIAELLLYD